MNNIEMPSLGELARRFGNRVIDEELSERLSIAVVDGRKVADGDANDFLEVVATTYDEVAEYFTGSGSTWVGDVIFIGADVVEDAKEFVVYHEFKHYLDYVGRGIVPADEHSSARSSRIEKECDLYALRRVVKEAGESAAGKAIKWMIDYHFQWNVEHPDDPSDLLYRAVLLYRFCRRQGLRIETVFDMVQLQKSQRWWR